MRPLKTVILKNDHDLFTFQQKVKNILGIEFPVSYLKQGRVRAFLNADGEIVAGYALITEGPFRTLSSIPVEVKNMPCEVEALSEVTALFIDHKVKSGVARCQFWLTFSRELANLSNKTHFMYAYDLEKTKLKKLYSLANPTVLFEGRTTLLEGMTAESDESVEVAKSSRIMYLPFYAMPGFVNRLFFRKPINEIRYFLEQLEEMRNSA